MVHRIFLTFWRSASLKVFQWTKSLARDQPPISEIHPYAIQQPCASLSSSLRLCFRIGCITRCIESWIIIHVVVFHIENFISSFFINIVCSRFVIHCETSTYERLYRKWIDALKRSAKKLSSRSIQSFEVERYCRIKCKISLDRNLLYHYFGVLRFYFLKTKKVIKKMLVVVGRIYYYLLMPGGSAMRGGPALLSSSANKPREASPQVGRPALPSSCALALSATYIHGCA